MQAKSLIVPNVSILRNCTLPEFDEKIYNLCTEKLKYTLVDNK